MTQRELVPKPKNGPRPVSTMIVIMTMIMIVIVIMIASNSRVYRAQSPG